MKKIKLKHIVVGGLIALMLGTYGYQHFPKEIKKLTEGHVQLGSQVKWISYTAPDKEFECAFPKKKPQKISKELPIPNSEETLPFNEFKDEQHEDITCSVSYASLPDKWLKHGSGLILKGALNLVRKSERGIKVVNRNSSKFKSFPSLEYIFHQGGQELRGTLILIGNKLYKIEMKYHESLRYEVEHHLTTFLQSFNPIS